MPYNVRDFMSPHQNLNPPPNYGEAMGNLGEFIAQQRQRGTENDFRARQLDQQDARDQSGNERASVEQEQRARGMLMDQQRGQRRDAMEAGMEDRRQQEAVFNRKRIESADMERLLHQAHFGVTPEEKADAEWALRNQYGVTVEDMYDADGGGDHVAPQAQPVTQQVAPVTIAPAPRKPMTASDQKLSGQLDQIDKTYTTALSGQSGMPYEQAMAQADASGARGVKQVGKDLWAPLTKADDAEADRGNSAPAPLLPGQRPMRGRRMRQDVEADLSPGDSLLNGRQ